MNLEYIQNKILNNGYKNICGVDESRAGCCAGDLIVSAVILPENHGIKGLNDSKKLSEKKREKFFDEIVEKAKEYSIIHISPQKIDEIGVFKARKEGFLKAVSALKNVDYAVVDGNMVPETNIPIDYLIKGDALMECISAASILAKVTGDRHIVEYKNIYPNFSFEKHKGYCTKIHEEEIKKFGVTEIHRKSYSTVYQFL